MDSDSDDEREPKEPRKKGAPRRASARGGSYGGGARSRRADSETRPKATPKKGGEPRPARDRGSRRQDTAGKGGRDERPVRRDPRSAKPTGRGSRDDSRGGGRRRNDDSEQWELPKGPKGWGRVARKGADAANRDDGRGAPQEPRDRGAPDSEMIEWQDVTDHRRPTGARSRRVERVEVHIAEESLAGLTQSQRDRVRRRMGEAAAAFEAERYEQCRKILHPLVERHSIVPELRELTGLCLYRLGKWRPALRHLEAFATATGSTDQHPVMADIERALGRPSEVRRLWEELRHDDADPAIITEGRIVLAGTLADDDDLPGAIRILEQGPVRSKRPAEHHLRLWYTLADLYERAGDLSKARRGFERIRIVDANFADTNDRLRSLG